jgi:adenylate cyclase
MAAPKGIHDPATAQDFPSELFAKFRAQTQSDFELEFYDHILERATDYVDVLKCQGELLTRKGLHKRGLVVDQRLAELRPHDCVVRYNLACSYALTGHKSEALASLRLALEAGYDDLAYLELDKDLESLRGEPAYQQLLDEFGASKS